MVGADISDGADVRANAGNEEEVKRLVESVAGAAWRPRHRLRQRRRLGRFATIAEQTADDWAEILRVNLIGPFLAIKHAAPLMRDAAAARSSAPQASPGMRSGAGGAAYSASKAGVISLVQTAAQQLSGTGVRVNAICPGLIETGMTKPIYDRRASAARRADRRAQSAASAAASPTRSRRRRCSSPRTSSSYVNGAALVVDGGLSSSHPTTRRFDLRML